MEPKYPALSVISNVFRAFGWFTTIWTVALVIIGVVSIFLTGDYLGAGIFGFLGSVLGAVWGSLMVLFFYMVIGGTLAVLYFAAAESIQVLVDIEKNTRSK